MIAIRCAGVTLIELLVVLAILGLLLGIAIPAVQQARETARRIACLSHLGQLGKAMHAHEAARNYFPPAMHDNGKHWFSPHAYMLDYLEQTAQSGLINFRRGVTPVLYPNFDTAHLQPIETFLGPVGGTAIQPLRILERVEARLEADPPAKPTVAAWLGVP